MSEEGSEADKPVEYLYVKQEDQSSSEDPPSIGDWTEETETTLSVANKKRLLHKQGLYSSGSGEVCAKYITMSNSSIFRHVYYNYPAVSDPGIKEALLQAEQPVIYPDDGQALYLHLCSEMNISPVRLFYRNLLNSDINLSYYGVNPQGVRAMAKALQFNKNVNCLNLTSNFLDDDACYHLGRMLGSNITLTELILAGCRIGATGMLRLGDSLRFNRSLMSLNVSGNNLGDAGGQHFAQQIFDGATVKKANLSNNKLGRECALALTEVWNWKNRFTHLDLSWNTFYHQPSTVKMLDQLALSTCLEELNLSFSALEGERIANAIKNVLLIPTLSELNLSHNRFQNEAIEIITTNLYQAKKLATFNLSFNPLTTQDAYNVLQKMLKPRVKIVNLLMDNVCVDKTFLELLARVKRMKSRKNFVCTFDAVLKNWSIEEPDGRKLILERAQYLGTAAKRNKVDIALYLLALAKEIPRPVSIKELLERLETDNVPLDENIITGLSLIFPGPKSKKSVTVNLNLISEYIKRLWPDKQLPPTPPEPEPLPEAEAALPQKDKPKEKGKK